MFFVYDMGRGSKNTEQGIIQMKTYFLFFLPGLGRFSLKINRKIMKKTKELQQESVKSVKFLKIPEIRAKIFFDNKEEKLLHN